MSQKVCHPCEECPGGNESTQRVIMSGMLCLILLLPFNEGGNGHVLQGITQLILLSLGLVWGIRTLRRGAAQVLLDWVDLAVLGFLGWTLVSLFHTDALYVTVLEMLKLFSYVAAWYLLRPLFPLKNRKILLLTTLFVSSVLQGGLAWFLFLTQRTPVLQADFVNPNNLACFVGIGINLGLGFVLFAATSSEPQAQHRFRLRKIVIAILLAGLIVTLLAIRSRGALLSLAGTGVFLTTLKRKKLGLFFLAFCCVIILLPTPWGNVLQRLQKQDDPFAYERVGIWKSNVQMTLDHPLLGVGSGMYAYYSDAYNFPVTHQIAHYGKKLNIAHSDLMQIATELGLVGLLCVLGGLARLAWLCRAQLCSHQRPWPLVAASAAILGIGLQGCFSTLLASPALAIMTVLLAGIVLDGARSFCRKTVHFTASWQWYLLPVVVAAYLLLTGIAYPFLAHTHYLKFQEYRKNKEFPSAVAHLQSALGYMPIHAQYHYTLGSLYLAAFRNRPNLDAFYESYRSLHTAIHFNARLSEAYRALGDLHRTMFYQKLRTAPTARNALDAYRQALRLHPYDPFLCFNMATIHADLEEFDQAIDLLQRAVTIEPNFVGGYQMLGKLFRHLRRQQEADHAFQLAENVLQRYASHPVRSDYTRSLLRPLH